MKLNKTYQRLKYIIAKIDTIVLLIIVFSLKISAQQQTFLINNHENPLKNFLLEFCVKNARQNKLIYILPLCFSRISI